MNIENQFQDDSYTVNSKHLGENLLGAFLILIIALVLTSWIIWPDLDNVLSLAMQTQNLMDWVYAIEGLLVTGFVVAFPLFLVVQSISHFRSTN